MNKEIKSELGILKSRLESINNKYPDLLQGTFVDYLYVLEHSADIGKYPLNNWLKPNGKGCDKKSMYGSTFRHVADAYAGVKNDKDSGIDPRLHAACRLMMDYTRDKYGLVHPNDIKNEIPDLTKDFFEDGGRL